MKQPKISTILRLAANEYLYDGRGLRYKSRFSCFAIREACDALGAYPYHRERIMIGLRRMGLKTNSLMAFEKFPIGHLRQGARFAWLHFAADIAEEQGL